MKSGNRSNALLVELLIVIMFFMLAATTLLQVFTAAGRQSDRSGQTIAALNTAQDLIDRLYASDAPDALLAENGSSVSADGTWLRAQDRDGLSARVTLRDEPTASGVLRRFEVSVLNGENEALITLDHARYEEVAP